MNVFDPVGLEWIDLSVATKGITPIPRWQHGFTSWGGKLFVHGGYADPNGQ